MRVDEVFKQAASQGTAPISFEMFPPKGELTLDTAREVAGNLCKLSPSFVSVTCSAGGSGNGATTAPIAHMISSEFDTPSVAHLTCVGRSHADIAAKIDEYRTAGVENILALRGDLPAGATEDDKPASDYAYARDLIPELVDAGFCVGAAAYPEGHIACEDLNASVEYLKQKQDAGASFFVTQLFLITSASTVFASLPTRPASPCLSPRASCRLWASRRSAAWSLCAARRCPPRHQDPCQVRERPREPAGSRCRLCRPSALRP